MVSSMTSVLFRLKKVQKKKKADRAEKEALARARGMEQNAVHVTNLLDEEEDIPILFT